jgi:hypothetical protein
MIMMEKNSIFAVMVAGEFSSKNLASTKIVR